MELRMSCFDGGDFNFRLLLNMYDGSSTFIMRSFQALPLQYDRRFGGSS